MHRHTYKGRKLRRKSGPRKALVRNLVSQVILYEKITTTEAKAKEIRPKLEKVITKAKDGTLAARRNVAKFLSGNDKALEKLFAELGPLYKDRNGGYSRIIKIENRTGDNAPMAVISLLDVEKLTKKEMLASSGAEKKKTNPSVDARDKTIKGKSTDKKEAPQKIRGKEKK